MEVNVPGEMAEIEASIQALSAEEKAELIRALIADLDGPADADVENAWRQEAKRRHRGIVEGKAQTVPGDRVFENLHNRLKR